MRQRPRAKGRISQILFALLLLVVLHFNSRCQGQSENGPPVATFTYSNETRNINNAPAFFPIYQQPNIPVSVQEAGLTFLADSIIPPSNVTIQYDLPRSVPFLTLGGIFDMTNVTTGDISPAGILYAEAFKCAIVDMNNNPSLLPNTTLLYQIFDSGSSSAQALNSAFLLGKLKAVSFIGNIQSLFLL